MTDQRTTAWGTTPADAMAITPDLPAAPEISMSFSAGVRVAFD